MKLIDRWEAYKRVQSESGYTFVPGDELIFRDAWNAAIFAAEREALAVIPPDFHGDTSQECADRVRALHEPNPYYAEKTRAPA